jgi:Flp pilus assembly protein TadD
MLVADDRHKFKTALPLHPHPGGDISLSLPMQGDCPIQKQELFDAFTAALARSNGNPNLTSAYADFALRELGDADLAGRMFREVVAARPNEPRYRSNLVQYLIATQQFEAAKSEISELAKLNRAGSLDDAVAALNAQLAEAQKAAAGPATQDELPQATSNR